MSSHLLGEIQAMVDDLVIIRFGKLLYSGSLDQLMTDAVEQVTAAPEHSERPRPARSTPSTPRAGPTQPQETK